MLWGDWAEPRVLLLCLIIPEFTYMATLDWETDWDRNIHGGCMYKFEALVQRVK